MFPVSDVTGTASLGGRPHLRVSILWDLVCNKKSLKPMAQSVYMGGVLVGALVLGALSDRFGRRTVLLWSHMQMAISGICAAFSSSFALYCFWRFVTGVSQSGITLNIFSLTVEWTPTNMRTLISTINGYSYTSGQLLLAGLAYGIRDWRWLQFTVSAPYFIFFLYSWWFPESARWLILNNKTDVALKQLKRVAKLNGKEAEGNKLTTTILKSRMEKELSNTKKNYGMMDLFRTPVMRKNICCSMCVWFAASFGYYGLAMDLQGFGVDIYLLQVIFGIVDIPAKTIAIVSMSFIGRRWTLGSSLILAGLITLTNIFVPPELQIVRTALAVIGKGCLSACFTCALLYGGELYPTVVRQTAIGLMSTMARVGAMLAPFAKLASNTFPAATLGIYGGVPIIAGIIAYLLPETRNIPLPDTIEDIESRATKDAEKDKEPKKEETVLQETDMSLL
ncbi:solute carrier family 22 member 6-A-like isoform X2 [Heptranchias perlo]|uniref:solute carrier family 22 member 6-A-like isoform X2 n=1 Tax=Heptranchias perlo TaxID=212740 RepID=UPI003559DD59